MPKLIFGCKDCGEEFVRIVSDMRPEKEDPCDHCKSENVIELPPDTEPVVHVKAPAKKPVGRPKKKGTATAGFDPVVGNVIQKFIARSLHGSEKYGISMAENDMSTLEWVEEAQDELMDAILYLERLKFNL